VNLIKIKSPYYALRILEITKTKVKWKHVNGVDNHIGTSKLIKAPLGTYFVIHDEMFRIEDFKEEITEFVPK